MFPDDADPTFAELDGALLALRRFWVTPDRVPDTRPDGGTVPVETSTLLVAEALRAAAEAGRDARVGDVAEALDVAPSTASRLVDRAIRAGAVAREPSPHDRRQVVLRLTDGGAELAERARAFRASRLDALLAGWSDDDRRALARLLRRLADAVRTEGGVSRPSR